MYPPVSEFTYSLTRFWRDYNANKLPSLVRVGGEISYECREQLLGGVFVLSGQGESLAFYLQKPVLGLEQTKIGDKVQITFQRDAIVDGAVRDASDFAILSPQQREPIYLNAGPAVLKKWEQFIDQVRQYFKSLGLAEVQTPSLVRNPGMEVELEPFAVELKVGSKRRKLFLPTSPELHLKQMLAAGFTDIFEIKSVFRNGEITDLHEPEFQMLEWYRAYADLNLIREDLIGLIKSLTGQKIEVRTASMAELFLQYLGFRLCPQTTRSELITLCRQHSVDYADDDDWNELFHRLMVEKVEPAIDPEVPLIVYDFPPSMAALARHTPQGFADRFELFWKGCEIANAFHELNDPVVQRQRFEAEIAERVQKGRTALEIDENFMRALESGLPPSGGIALGLDRLFMCLNGIQKIQQSRAFSVRHQGEPL